MLCGYGQTYVVNEDYTRRKKDSSFRSFITAMFAVLLAFLVIYCLILTINKYREHDVENPDSNRVNNETPNLEINDKLLYGRLHENATENSAKPSETTIEGNNSSEEKSSTTPDFRKDHRSWTDMDVSSTIKADVESNIAEKNEGTTRKIVEGENKEDTITTTEFSTIWASDFPIDGTIKTDASFKSKEYTTIFAVLNAEKAYGSVTTTSESATTTSRKQDVEQAKRNNVGSDKENEQVEAKEWKVVASTTESDVNYDSITRQVQNTETTATTICVTSLGNEAAAESSYVDVDLVEGIYSEKSEPTTTSETEKMMKDHPDITTFNTVIEKQLKTDSTASIQKEETTDMTKNNGKATTVLEDKSEIITEAFTNANYLINLRKPTSAAPLAITSAPPVTSNESNHNIIIGNLTTPLSVLINSTENNLIPKETKRICSSPECKQRASEILGRMDHSPDPCEDFYRFSCGGGSSIMGSQKADVLLEFLYKTNTTDDLQVRSFKKFFDSCVNYENEFGYSDKIQHVSSSNIGSNNLTTLLAFLLLRQTAPLFDVRMGFIDNKEGYGLQVLPPSASSDTDTLNAWSLQSHIEKECIRNSGKFKYEEEADLQKIHEEFEECRNGTFAKKMNDFVSLQKNGRKQNEDNNDPDWKFLLNKVKVSSTAIQKAVSDRLYKKTDVDYLNRKFSCIDWKILFGKMRSNFDPSMPIYLYMEEAYFEPLMRDLSKRLVDNEEETLNAIKLYYQLQLYENLVSPKDDVDYFCVNQAASLMPEIAENIFVRSNPAVTYESGRLETIFDELKGKFYWLLDISNMGENDKDQLKTRLAVLKLATFKVGAVKNVLVEKYRESISGDYLSNLFRLLEDKRGINTREDFVRNLYTTFQNFDYPKVVPNEDAIVVPNSFIYRIIQNKKAPSYISETYAKFHLSRAIAIYLEEVARRSEEMTFHVQFQKILNKYLDGMDMEISWKNQRLSYKNNYEMWTSAIDASTSDRTADNIALQIAFGSIFPQNEETRTLPWISDDYNPEKQFFVLVVQDYCESSSLLEVAKNLFGTPDMPGVFRTDAMITNSREFETAFTCPPGSRMNPPDKVEYAIFIPEDYSNYANNYDDQLSK